MSQAFTIVLTNDRDHAIQVLGRHSDAKLKRLLTEAGIDWNNATDWFTAYVGEAISKPIGTKITAAGIKYWDIEKDKSDA